MRTFLPPLLLASLLPAKAQLINGSFEQGTTGWTLPCECQPLILSTDVGGGSGTHCLGLQNYQENCPCFLFTPMQQRVPWITPGPWRISGWIKSAVANDFPGSSIQVAGDGVGFISLNSFAGEWDYMEGDFWISTSDLTDSVRVFIRSDDGDQQPPALCYFDDIRLTSLLSTGLPAPAALHTYLDNDGTLHLDVQDLAVQHVRLLDAGGRIVPLTPAVTARSISWPTGALSTGVYIVQVLSDHGLLATRFLKT